LPLRSPATYAADLNGIVRRLARQRTAARARLASASTPRRQAVAAIPLAVAYRRAAQSLASTPAPLSLSADHAALLTTLRAAYSAYGQLARTARAADAAGFAATRAAVASAERNVDTALTQIGNSTNAK
jgi:hypothetical protein